MIPCRMNPLGITVNENLPLTLTAEQANSTVTLNATGSPTVSGLHYRLGRNGLWLPYTIGTTITLANIGDSVQFWNSGNALSTSNKAYVKFVMSGIISGKGDIMSIMNWSDNCPYYGLWQLFNGCLSLVQAPDLTAKTLGEAGYGSILRSTRIIHSPKISAENFAYNGCLAAFRDCINLIDIPTFRSTVLVSDCLRSAFQGCTSLTSAKIHATALGDRCCESIFDGCSSLSAIEADLPSWGTLGTEFTNWVRGVAASGTFTKPTALPEEYGGDKIPTGWTVVNK